MDGTPNPYPTGALAHLPTPAPERTAHFPPELVDHVFKEMTDMELSLTDCLLVCREWTRIAYPYHFRRIHYLADEPDYYSRRVPYTVMPRKWEAHSWKDLITFLQYSPMVRACIQELHYETPSNEDSPSVFLELGVLSAIINLLPRLRFLEISVHELVCHSAETGTLLSPSPVRLDRLRLSSPLCDATALTVTTLLHLFSSIRCVEFENILVKAATLWPSSPRPTELLRDTRFRIESIDLSVRELRHCEAWVCSVLPSLDPTAPTEDDDYVDA